MSSPDHISRAIGITTFLLSTILINPTFAQDKLNTHFVSLLDSARAKSAEQKWKEAADLWQQVVDQNPVNGSFYGSLAQAHFNAGDLEKSITMYKKQLELGDGLVYNIAYNIARSYAVGKNKENALNWLEKAFALGFGNFRYAQTDTIFKDLHANPRFQKIVALKSSSTRNRDEGWRYDLELLQREVDRKAYKGSPRFNSDTVRAYINRLVKQVPKLSDNEIILEITRIMAKVGDGHSWAMPPMHMYDWKNTLPLQFYYFKEGMYIISSHPSYKDLLGSRVLEYAGIPVEKLTTVYNPYISYDNVSNIVQRTQYLMRSPVILKTLKLADDASRVNLKIVDLAGIQKTVIVVADTTQPNIWNILPNPPGWINLPQTLGKEIPLYLKHMDKLHWWEMLPGNNTVYCQVNRIRNDRDQSFTQFAQRLSHFLDSTRAKKLILDFRWNNGGNTGLVIPFINFIISNDTINRRGNLFVIIGRRTYSAAQNTVTFLERFTNAIFVGEPTGSSPNFVGEEEPLELPYSKMVVNVSDLFWQTSWPEDKRIWIAPLLYTPPAFEFFRTNRDPALEVILNYPLSR